MEAFAYGIQCVLNKDWDGVVKAFLGSGFVRGARDEASFEQVKGPRMLLQPTEKHVRSANRVRHVKKCGVSVS